MLIYEILISEHQHRKTNTSSWQNSTTPPLENAPAII